MTQSIRLTDFMKRLVRSPDNAIKRDEPRKLMRIYEIDEIGRTLDIFVARLRHDIEKQVKNKRQIEAVPR